MKFLLTLLLFCSPVVLSAQPEFEWMNTYGTDDRETCWSAIRCHDGGYALVGSRSYYRGVRSEFYLIRTDANGDSLWSCEYGGDDDDALLDVVLTSNGGFLLAGGSESFTGDGSVEGYLLMVDSVGSEIWSVGYQDIELDHIKSIVSDDSNYILAGGGGQNNVVLVCVDSLGESNWTNEYGGNGSELPKAVATTADDGFAVAGVTRSFGNGGWDFYLVKTDESGEEEWSETYGTNLNDHCMDMIHTSDGGYLLVGIEVTENGGSSAKYIKTDEDGEVEWTNNEFIANEFNSVIELDNGDFVIGGYIGHYGTGAEFCLIRLGIDGEVMWFTETDNSRWNEKCTTVLINPDGSYTLAGNTNQRDKFVLAKTEPDSFNSIWDIDPSQPSAFKLHPVYPNPFNSITTLSYNLPTYDVVTLSILDMNGRQIESLLSGSMRAGQHSINWNASEYPSGIYFARLQSGSHSNFVKITLMR